MHFLAVGSYCLMGSLKRFWEELKRRRVVTTSVGYIVAAWVLLQVADVLLPIYETPDIVIRLLSTGLILGFPLVVLLSWFFNLSLEGINLTESAVRKTSSDLPPAPEGPSIAVFPIKNISGEDEQGLFAAALTNDIITGLTQSSHLFVFASGATEGVGEAQSEVLAACRELGAKYLLHGTLRQSRDHLRVSAHLIEAASGVEIWSENYDRSLSADQLFAIQDDIRQCIVATISDLHGVIYSTHSKRSQRRPTNDLKAYELLAIALEYDKYISPENHLRARRSLEEAVALDPLYDEAWAHLSWIYTDEWVWGFNPLPDSQERALNAALQAIKLAPENYHNHWLLSRVYYFKGDLEGFRAESGRALELNARDGTTLGLIGIYTAWTGDWHKGIDMMRQAMKLNPNYPPYYHVALATWHYQDSDFSQAIEELAKANLPEWTLSQVFKVATHVRLGQFDLAQSIKGELSRSGEPSTAADVADYLNRALPFLPDLVREVSEPPIWAS